MYAARDGHHACVMALITAGANYEAKDIVRCYHNKLHPASAIPLQNFISLLARSGFSR